MAHNFWKDFELRESKVELNAFPHPKPWVEVVVGITSEQFSEEIGVLVQWENLSDEEARLEEVQDFPGEFNREWELDFKD